jgi:hypothetical protein
MKYDRRNVYRGPVRQFVVFGHLLLARIKHSSERGIVFVDIFVFLKEREDIVGTREREVER